MDAQRLNPLECDLEYDVAALSREVAIARAVQDFERGAYGHSISLPAAQQLDPLARRHHNNLPFADVLDRCPYLAEILAGLEAPKLSYRLLRRAAHTAYALHDDKDKGAHIVRLQIPIVTNERSFLFLPTDALDLEVFGPFVRAAKAETELPFDLECLRRLCGSELRLFRLRPGRLYYFDTDRIHTLLNAGDQDRITLSIDLIRNDWLHAWMGEHFTRELEPDSLEGADPIRWNWNALRHGVIRNEPHTH
jgi:hypothetical protein